MTARRLAIIAGFMTGLAASWIANTACGRTPPTAPPGWTVPTNAVEYAAGPPEAAAFDTITRCLDSLKVPRHGSLGAVHWFRAPGYTFVEQGETVIGAFIAPASIVIADSGAPPAGTAQLRKHELAHYLTGAIGHAAPFWAACNILPVTATTVFVIPGMVP